MLTIPVTLIIWIFTGFNIPDYVLNKFPKIDYRTPTTKTINEF